MGAIQDVVRHGLIQLKQVTPSQERREENKVKKYSKTNTDPFVSALRMAIENDGEIDKCELTHLKKLEKRSSRIVKNKVKKRYRKYNYNHYRFSIFFDSQFTINFHRARRKKKVQIQVSQNRDYKIDHSTREAFKIAALDGKVNENELAQLKILLGIEDKPAKAVTKGETMETTKVIAKGKTETGGTIRAAAAQGRLSLDKLRPNQESILDGMMEGIQAAKELSIATATGKALSHDKFEVALRVASVDGEITSEEQKILDRIRDGEKKVDLYSPTPRPSQ